MNAGSLQLRLRRADIVVMLFGLAAGAVALADGTGWYTSEQVAQGRWEILRSAASVTGSNCRVRSAGAEG